ncbi:MAG: hypothetical protein P1U83_01765 [Roseovarius sp.]|nr:hypothetical protein [Roseovarius sp.]
MGGNAIRTQNTDVERAKFHPSHTKRLLSFNITKQRVADLCNQEWKENPFEKEVNYSSWHRAMDGHEVFVGVISQLEGLYEAQKAHPKKFLPQDDPGENLREWMGQIAKATWWHKTLELEMPLNSLNSWFSGRVSKTRPELLEKVNDWWARVKTAADEAERYSAVRERDRYRDGSFDNGNARSWDSWCKDLLEDGLSVEELRERYIAEALMHDQHHLNLIDLSNPDTPLTIGYVSKSQEEWRGQQLDELLEQGFPRAMSRTPPDFDPEPFIRHGQWGDRRNEECPKDINSRLYGKHYRERCVRFWDVKKRCVSVNSEIVEVSVDGENWRPANETEKKGWDNGIFYWEQALIETGEPPENSYTRELNEAKLKEKKARREFESNLDVVRDSGLQSALMTAERELKIAFDNTHGQYD